MLVGCSTGYAISTEQTISGAFRSDLKQVRGKFFLDTWIQTLRQSLDRLERPDRITPSDGRRMFQIRSSVKETQLRAAGRRGPGSNPVRQVVEPREQVGRCLSWCPHMLSVGFRSAGVDDRVPLRRENLYPRE